MDQRQRDLRHAAAEAFLESLDQLEANLTPEELAALDTQMGSNSCTNPAEEMGVDANVQALEAAAADIEQFIQSHVPEEPNSPSE